MPSLFSNQELKPQMTDYEIKFLDAAIKGDIKMIEQMLQAGIDVNAWDDRKMPKNRTALMHAAANGHLEAVELLLKSGAKLEAKDKGAGCDWPGGNTALILAIVNKHVPVANRLLDVGANPKTKGGGTTAIRAAVEIGNFDLVKRLSELGADPEEYSTDKISAVLSSILGNHKEILEFFLNNGANANAKTPGEASLIEIAVHEGNLEICKLLFRFGSNPNVKTQSQQFTPLMMACQKENTEIVQFLLSVGAEVNVVNVRNESALDIIEKSYQDNLNESPSSAHRIAKKEITLKALEEIRSLLRKARAKRSEELKPEKAQINLQPDNHSEHLGITHFLKFMYDGQPEWSLFAVKASIDDVSEMFVQFRKAKNITINVLLKPAGEYDDLSNAIAIVKVKNNPWTIVFRSLLTVDSAELENVPVETKELSIRLKTRAITFIGEDTSGAMGFEIYKNGKLLEKAEWESGGEFFSFESTLRERPELEEVGDEFADQVFRKEGIYLPACYPKSDGGKSWLAVEKNSENVIERADLVEL